MRICGKNILPVFGQGFPGIFNASIWILGTAIIAEMILILIY